MYREQRPGYFAHVQYDLNLRILRMFEGFSFAWRCLFRNICAFIYGLHSYYKSG